MIIQETLQTKVVKEYDVAVCGGGFGGISAALAAARQGKKTVLFEKENLLGGLGTLGLITIYLPLCDGYGHQVSFGIAEELSVFPLNTVRKICIRKTGLTVLVPELNLTRDFAFGIMHSFLQFWQNNVCVKQV